MKNLKLLLLILLLPLLALAGSTDPSDVRMTQNNTNVPSNGTVTRYLQFPGGGASCIPALDGGSLLPTCLTLGSGVSISGGALQASFSQVNADWTASSGAAQVLHKPSLATVATSGAYADLAGTPTLSTVATTGAYADLTGKPALFDGQYTSLTSIPSTFTPAAHTQAWSTITSTPTTMAGYGIGDGVTSTSLTSQLSSYATAASLSSYATTSALSSGLASKFDTPAGTTAQYVRGDGSLTTFPTLTSGTVTSVIAGTGLAGGTITASGTISMPSTGTAGTYSGVTTDAQGRVTAGTARSFAYQTRSLNSCFQASSTRDVMSTYTVEISTVSTLSGGQTGTVYLRIYTNSGCTTGTQEVARFVNGNNQSLGLSVTMTQNVSGILTAIIPAGSYVQLVTENTTGAPTFTARPGQEVLL